MATGDGTVSHPWQLQTPPLSSEYMLHRDVRDGVDVLVCTVGKTVQFYDARCIEELHAWRAAGLPVVPPDHTILEL